MGYFPVRYDSRVVNYDRRGFIILATALLLIDDRSLKKFCKSFRSEITKKFTKTNLQLSLKSHFSPKLYKFLICK